jgi:hypothetical protein
VRKHRQDDTKVEKTGLSIRTDQRRDVCIGDIILGIKKGEFYHSLLVLANIINEAIPNIIRIPASFRSKSKQTKPTETARIAA